MPHSTPSRPPPRVLPVTPNPSSLESAALALSPYRSSSVSPSSSGNSTKTVGTASPSPRLQLSPGAGLTGSLAAAESGRVLQGARLGRARWGLLEQAEVALEAVEECRNEVARVREEVEAAFSQLTTGSGASLSPEQDMLLEARALELAIPVEAGLVFEFTQLKEIDKEALAAVDARPSAAAVTAYRTTQAALLPATARLGGYRKAFAARLDRAEEAYAREAGEIEVELGQLRARLANIDDDTITVRGSHELTRAPVDGEVQMIEFAEGPQDVLAAKE